MIVVRKRRVTIEIPFDLYDRIDGYQKLTSSSSFANTMRFLITKGLSSVEVKP